MAVLVDLTLTKPKEEKYWRRRRRRRHLGTTAGPSRYKSHTKYEMLAGLPKTSTPSPETAGHEECAQSVHSSNDGQSIKSSPCLSCHSDAFARVPAVHHRANTQSVHAPYDKHRVWSCRTHQQETAWTREGKT
eukprot:1156013-Pelagomonas_calceolata.AAC.9